MEFIFNSRQRKVEVFYNNAREQQALFEFLSQWMTYKEDKSSTICDDKGITWTTSNVPDNILINYDDTLVSNNLNLGQNMVLNNSSISATAIERNALNQAITSDIELNAEL